MAAQISADSRCGFAHIGLALMACTTETLAWSSLPSSFRAFAVLFSTLLSSSRASGSSTSSRSEAAACQSRSAPRFLARTSRRSHFLLLVALWIDWAVVRSGSAARA